MSTATFQYLRALLVVCASLLAPGASAQPAMLGGVVDQIVAGGAHTCLLNAEDTLRCWGSNQFGQLGDNTLTPRTTPSGVSFNLGPQLLTATAGARHTCALTAGVDAGKVYCFGANAEGALGDGTTIDRPRAVAVTGLIDVLMVSAGSDFTCAVLATGRVKCWGRNGFGELGDGTVQSRSTSVPVVGLPTTPINALATGDSHVCAIELNGKLVCWGRNHRGQIQAGGGLIRPVTAVPFVGSAIAVAAGAAHSCALSATRAVTCWGANDRGQLGDGTFVDRASATVEVTLPEAVIAIAAGGVHTCALLAGGSTRCWGGNDHGQLGDGSALDRSSPVVANVGSLQSPVTMLSLGATHSCASTLHGGALCWGGNASAQVGDATTIDRPLPFFVSGFSAAAKRVVAGNVHSCALSASGEIYCWGSGAAGQLGRGNGQINDLYTPTPVLTLGPRLLDLATGGDSSCAITEGGEARCWGRNDSGQLGDTTVEARGLPTEVLGVTAMRRISIGLGHACGVSMAAEVFCWGANGSGQLGFGFRGPIAPADRVPMLSGVQQIAVGGLHTCAILTSGLLQCWGSNYYGQMGDGQTLVDNLIPSPPLLIGRVLAVALGIASTCAIEAPGIVNCWGANRFGQLGDGTTVDRVTPVIVSALPQDIVSLSAAVASTCAVSGAVGALYCWGYNNDGQLGVTGAMMYTTPTLVIASGVASVTMGNNHACAVMRDGGLRCWGGIGTIGNGSGSGAEHPKPVRGGQWIDFTVPALIDVDSSVLLSPSALAGGTVVVDQWTPNQCAVSIFGPQVTAFGPATCGLRARQGGGNLVAHGSPAPAPRQLRQTWVPKAYFVRPNVAGSDGIVSPDVLTAVREGDTLGFTVTAALGFFPTIETQCGGAVASGVYTTARVFADCTALFRFSTSAVAGSCFDIDGSGSASAAIDGVILNRYLAGIRGDALVAGLTGLGPRRTGAAIEAFFGNAARYDVIGRAVPSPTLLVDGLILLRLMQGLTAAELLNGIAIPAGARYTTASAIMQHVAEICAVKSVP